MASEVRALDQRSSEAASEIAELIDAADVNVTTGAELVRRSGETLNSISERIGAVAGRIGDIVSAVKATNSGVSEVSQATGQLDAAIQQNSAMLDQTNVAIQSLNGDAKKMADLVGAFVFDDERLGQPAHLDVAARTPVAVRRSA